MLPDSQTQGCIDFDIGTWGGCPAEGEAGFGQDGSFNTVPPVYTTESVNGQDLLVDGVTGLVWQVTLSGEVPDTIMAFEYCANLDYGGRSDWRIPTRLELVTILDIPGSESGSPFAKELEVLPSDNYLWSDTEGAAMDGETWAFSDFGWAQTHMNVGGFGTYRARCVAGGPTPGPDFVLGPDGDTVLDERTGLEWERNQSADLLVYLDALAYCAALDAGGHDDWRLPSIKEGLSLLIEEQTAPAFSELFTGARVWNWSSTPSINPFSPTQDFHIYESMSGTSSAREFGDATAGGARCVRGPRPAP